MRASLTESKDYGNLSRLEMYCSCSDFDSISIGNHKISFHLLNIKMIVRMWVQIRGSCPDIKVLCR